MKKESSQSVTNAILDQKLSTLTETVKTLTESVTKGFEGVHARQDTTNGKVIKAGADILANKAETDKQAAALLAKFQYNRIIWYLLTTCVSVIIALASYIVFKH